MKEVCIVKVNSKCCGCGLYSVRGIDEEYCESCEVKWQGILAAVEKMPWQSINDVPLDAWFRTKPDLAYLIDREWVIRPHSFRTNIPNTSVDCLRFGCASYSLMGMFESFEWSMTPLDESSWKPCNMRYRKQEEK